ncbi:M56 family metallopeptidase [Clostridium sp. 'deep sea']|uniref:M56 family metallopeptidase n=1 Tax=Clostridium sp. 'deep sea' TaxID=2779445 RepID=UPI0018964D40|nr:M56 family metallopeptidase [Clostridium sp. 'deep sea']QOR35123.1 M56 family metallopeptidase [Clostridium sp. 'deep sea']
MSIMGSFVGLIVLVLVKLLHKFFPQKFIFALWAIVAFRFLFPLTISSKYSLINLIAGRFAKAIHVKFGETFIPIRPPVTTTNFLLAVKNYQPLVYKNDNIESLFNIISNFWFVGLVIAVIVAIVLYILTIKQFKTATLVKGYEADLKNCCKKLKLSNNIKLKQISKLKTPVVMGIVNATIILPTVIKEDYVNYILLHECSHIKRRDNLWRLVSIFITCIHWFNPFVWYFLYLCERDIEKACDEKVVTLISKQQVKEYASVLISLSQKQTTPLLALGNTAVKERIINITNYKKLSLLMIIITVILLTILSVLLSTNQIIS